MALPVIFLSPKPTEWPIRLPMARTQRYALIDQGPVELTNLVMLKSALTSCISSAGRRALCCRLLTLVLERAS